MRTTSVIRNGSVVDALARTVSAMDILVEAGKITAVGMPGMDAPKTAKVIDATNRLMIPGLVNAHTHSHGNLVRSAGDKWTLELGIHLNTAIRRNQTLEDKYLGALLGAVEMVSKGCTACYDLVAEVPFPTVEGVRAVGQAYVDVGMRAVVSPMMSSCSIYHAIPGLRDAMPAAWRDKAAGIDPRADDINLDVTRRLLHEWAFDRDQVRMAIAPTIPLHCSDNFWKGAAALAREYGVGLHTHLAESKIQAVAGMERYGCTLTDYLDRMGVLGPNLTVAHGVWLDDADISRLADQGATLAHNPGSNMRYGSGMAAVRRMVDRGLSVAIGTDSRSCSDNLNMFEAMRLASYTSRVRGPDYRRWLGTDEVFGMATAGSARALGFGDLIGQLKPGYFADIVFLDSHNLNYVPLNDITNQVVNAEDGTAVDSVMIGGRMILDRGHLTTIDVAALSRRAQNAVARMRNVNDEALRAAAALEDVFGSFCIALGSRDYHVHRYVEDDARS
jgi:5-methylthioadenosine/S-adenosylhomocysteine deaminase